MKHLRLIVLSVLLSLLFTSCLADILNEQFGFTPPVILTYESNWGKRPSRTKHPSGEPLTQEELPVLSEQGWDFGGWYTDSDYNNPVTEGTILSENTKLYAKWIPRTDTPYTIINYFMNPRENGSYVFIHKPEYDQHLTGTTDLVIWNDNDIIYEPQYSTELSNYSWFTLQDFNERRIKGDGSTVLNNYHHLSKIYQNEFEGLLSAMPESNINFYFEILDNGSSLDFANIKNIINNNCRIEQTSYDNYSGKYIYTFNRSVNLSFASLSFTEIPSYAFSYTPGLRYVFIPASCDQIGQGAFYGCDGLFKIEIDHWDDNKTWHCSNGTNLGYNPDPENLANLLKTNEYIYLSRE